MRFFDLLFPPRCLRCQTHGYYICPDCLNTCQPLQELYCPVCRKHSLWGNTHRSCSHANLDGLISCYPYSGVIKKIITSIKYSLVSDAVSTVTECMISTLTHPQLFEHSWTLIPVPLHARRYAWRGFNQATHISKALANNWHFPHNPDILIRSLQTSAQMSLSGKARSVNLSGAFQVRSSCVPSYVLLVDDVATTCTTLSECAGVLKRAGSQVVWGLTLAQVIPHPK